MIVYYHLLGKMGVYGGIINGIVITGGMIVKHQGTKIIETKRLMLRPFREEDAEPMFRHWAADPEVTKFLTWPPHETVEVSKQVIQSWIENYKDLNNYQWAIEWKEIHEPIGSISAVRTDDRTEAATIGYCIGRNWWGRGITAEALQAVMEFFFDEVGMNCINACHDPRNPNSGKVMKKCGMTYEGTWRAGGVNNQGVCDESWYSMLRKEYQEKAQPEAPFDEIWDELYKKALAVQGGRKISDYVEAGGVAAAILTKSGNIYTGVCVDTSSTLGICAERNAMFSMLTHGEHEMEKVLAIMPDGRTGAPCGACRELMVQLMPNTYKDIEIMLDYSHKRVITLDKLTPEWWISCDASL